MTQQPVFDPSKPSQVLTSTLPSDAMAPAFDPSKPSTAQKDTPPPRAPGLLSQSVDAIESTLGQFIKVPAQAIYQAGKAGVDALIDPLQAINETIPNAIGNVASSVMPTATEFPKIMESIQAGRLDYGLIHTLNSLVPGWKIAQDQLLSWIHRAPSEGPRVASEMFWSIAPFMQQAAGAATVRGPLLRDPNPAMASAIDTARANGVNVPVGAATGRPILTQVQELSDRSTVAGGAVAAKETEALRDQMTQWGERLKNQAHPNATTPLQAGQSVVSGVRGTVSRLNSEASAEYGAIEKRQAAAPPQSRVIRPERIAPDGTVIDPGKTATIQMPVDLRPAQSALSKIVSHFQDVINAGGTLTAPEVEANRVLRNFVNGDEFASLTTSEDVLGTIKAAERKATTPETKALLGQAVKRLDAQVMSRAAQEGSDITDALIAGRLKTAKKFDAQKLLERDLGVKDIYTAEPAKVADKILNASNDSRATLAARVARVAPDAMPELGRAAIEKILDTGASSENGLGRVQTMLDRWNAMGDQTKRIFYKDAIAQNPNYIRDVDQFFRVAQRIQKQMNPSGSAGQVALAARIGHGGAGAVGAILGGQMDGLAGSMVGAMAAEGAGALTSKLLRSPRFVSMLVEQTSPSFRMLPVAQQTARAASLAQLFHEVAGGEMFAAAPAFAQSGSTPPPQTTRR